MVQKSADRPPSGAPLQQGCPDPPHAPQLPPLLQVPGRLPHPCPELTHVAPAQQCLLPHVELWQQGCPVPPHAAGLPFSQTLPPGRDEPPGWQAPPEQQPCELQVLPPQQG
jgi:hypothetical protein